LHTSAATVFEYDIQGKMLGWYNHYDNNVYTPRNDEARSIECWVNHASDNPNEYYGELETQIPESVDYRCYTATMAHGEIISEWTDVTGTDAYTELKTPVRKIVWNTLGNKLTLLRLDSQNCVTEYTKTFDDGVLDFEIEAVFALPTDAHAYRRTQLVPMGHYDVELNGYTLIPDIDYQLDFPKVIILNKDYLQDGDEQNILVRGMGFCQADFSQRSKRDTGFVVDGMLSKNRHYNVRDDIVMRFTVGGKLVHRDQLNFAEFDTGFIMLPGENGAPFMASEILVPMGDAITGDSMALRDISRELDGRIEAYMTNFLPERGDGLYPIPRLYPLYSPTISAIIVAVMNGGIAREELEKPIVDMRILTLCEPYIQKWWQYDPANAMLGVDENFVIVHPHPYMTTMWLDIFQYRFVKRAMDLITRGKVQLSHFIQMEQ
jgi:hypothetical protein